MTPTEILRAAKAKIADPKNWCQGDYARDARNFRVGPESVFACRWCAVGAIRSVGGFKNDYDALFATGTLVTAAGTLVIDLNDSGTHADVMAMFDRAIALAEASS